MILMTLLSTLLKYQFVEKLYPATVAGLEYSCYPADMGLVLKVTFDIPARAEIACTTAADEHKSPILLLLFLPFGAFDLMTTTAT